MSATRTKKLDLTGVQVNGDFEKIIIHHTATKRMKKYGVEWCRDLHDGKIKMGRTLHKRGAHCLGQNTWSIGIAFVGGLDKDGEASCTLTDTQKKSIAVAIKALREHTGKLLPVYSHNEFRNTFCPGFDASLVDWEAELDDGARDTE